MTHFLYLGGFGGLFGQGLGIGLDNIPCIYGNNSIFHLPEDKTKPNPGLLSVDRRSKLVLIWPDSTIQLQLPPAREQSAVVT